MRSRTLLLFLAALAAGAAMAESAKVVQNTELRAEPKGDAAVLGEVQSQAEVAVLDRKGAWYKVKSGGNEGWVRMTALRYDAKGAPVGSGDSGLGAIISVATTGRSGSSGVTAATGIKGWDEQNVLNATPDHQALAQMDRYAASGSEARDFASKGQLRAHQVAYPGASSGGSSGGSNNAAPATKEGAF